MIRRVFFITCIGLAVGCACTHENDTNTDLNSIIPDTPIEQPKDINVRIATWNVHNLFDTICDSYDGCGLSKYEPTISESSYRSKITKVGKGIQKIDADIILLQEIEKESCLVDVQTYLGSNLYLGYAFGEIGTSASVDVAILTRGLLTNVFTYRNQYWVPSTDGSQKRMSRELLGAEITLPNGIELTVFTTHFISMYSDPEGVRRMGEAKIVNQVLDDYIAKHPGRLVVFGGDLNSTPDSEQIQLLNNNSNLKNVTDVMNSTKIITWGGQYTLDYLFYTSENEKNLSESEIFCDNDQSNGFSSSDHCAVKATFHFTEG